MIMHIKNNTSNAVLQMDTSVCGVTGEYLSMYRAPDGYLLGICSAPGGFLSM